MIRGEFRNISGMKGVNIKHKKFVMSGKHMILTHSAASLAKFTMAVKLKFKFSKSQLFPRS